MANMICNNCLMRMAQPNALSAANKVIRRAFTSSSITRAAAVSAQTATATNPRPNDKPAATSTSAAQPFTAGTTPKNAAPTSTASPKPRQPSSALAGLPLRGINYMKNQQDPIALEDHEYPDWLWEVLDKKESKKDDLDGEGDLFSKSAKQRRIAAKALRKQQLRDPNSMVPKVPLYEQTIDIYAGDGTLEGAARANAARQELTKAMRDQRRNKIKETNFLKTM
ncbi:hypothetical protein AMS68_003547 [Peltaster fructicola]|uniref:Large ribosomal subunit protein mL54 n=1 Tax=Peltaster fructicola TaxID=286661 RepID=A0A6H0XUA3_9PEZI|nr:hypothetical protein AMS68_003547 [Peltaster fructicola]